MTTPPPLSSSEIKTLREMIRWYKQIQQDEEDQFKLEEELADFPTHGDGF